MKQAQIDLRWQWKKHEAEHLSIMAQLGSTGEGIFVQFHDGRIFVEVVKHVKTWNLQTH